MRASRGAGATPFPFLSLFSFYFSERHTRAHTALTHTSCGTNAVPRRVSELGGGGAGSVAALPVLRAREAGVMLCSGTQCHTGVEA